MMTYAIVSTVALVVLFALVKTCSYCRRSKQQKQSIEAFAYDEATGVQTNGEDNEREQTNVDYQGLAGSRPTTPAVF